MSNDHQHINEILKYLTNKMSDKDRYGFERKMESDPFLMDAVDGYSGMNDYEIEEELLLLENKINQKKTRRLVPIWLRVAASVALLLGIGTLFLLLNKDVNKKQGLVSDKIELKRGREEAELAPEITKETQKEPIERAKINYDEKIEEKEEVEIIQPKKVIKEAPMDKFEVRKVEAEEVVDQQKVDMSLRYEDTAVKAEKELLGEISGVDVNEVEGYGDFETKIKIRGASSFLKDTSTILFSGKVVDESGMPLPGVAVSNFVGVECDVNTYKRGGVVTDTGGNFSIEGPKAGAVLQLNYIGFKDQIAVAKKDSVGELVMEPQQLAMDEVVTMAYGSEERKDLRRMKSAPSAKKVASNNLKGVENKLLPEPVGGMNKFLRRLERDLKPKKSERRVEAKVEFEVFISKIGVVKDIKVYSEISAELEKKLKDKLKEVRWIAPQINGVAVESNRKIELILSGN